MEEKEKKRSGARLLSIPKRFATAVSRSYYRCDLDMMGSLFRRRAAFIVASSSAWGTLSCCFRRRVL